MSNRKASSKKEAYLCNNRLIPITRPRKETSGCQGRRWWSSHYI